MAAVTRTPELDAVRQRRAELRETIGELERALAAPSGSADWRSHTGAALDRLGADFALHVEVTEGQDGLHQAILAGDLRLANAVEALTAEHSVIAAELAVVSAVEDPDELRERATSLLGRLVRHRQRGADLVYQAFVIDIGGGD